MVLKKLLFVFLTLLSAPLHAQITLDGTLGPATALTGPNYDITSNFGQTIGSNLFHSFNEFNLTAAESATFSGPNSIANILSRVTGGNPSSIDGLLRSTIPGANFFFLNPFGVMFGPNAAIDVDGAFTVSTADLIRLGDDGLFDAMTPENSILTSAPPEAFGFLTGTPAALSFDNSFLSVENQQPLSMIAGDIQIIGGKLTVPGGTVNMVSLGSEGEVGINVLDPQSPVDVSSFKDLGDITLSDGNQIDLDGDGGGGAIILGHNLVMDNAFTFSETLGDSNGGDINILLTGNLAIFNGAEISSNTFGFGKAGSITISAETILLDGGQAGFTRIGAQTFGDGTGGNIQIATRDLQLVNGALINGNTFFRGDAGSITISADTILLDDGDRGLLTGLETETFAGGRGGKIQITTRDLQLVNGARISVATLLGPGDAGNITIGAERILLDGGQNFFTAISAATSGRGTGGNIQIVTGDLQIINGALLNGNTFSRGDAGSITISADTVLVDGGLKGFAGIFSETSLIELIAGKGGDIEINTKNLKIINGAQLRVGTRGFGDVGTIKITAETIVLDGGALNRFSGINAVSLSLAAVKGGTIQITTNDLKVVNGAQIAACTFGGGDGGDIVISAETILLDDGGQGFFTAIEAETSGDGTGGEIQIATGNLLILNGARIEASSTETASGDAGSITIGAEMILLDGNGDISTRIQAGSEGEGDARDIMISTGNLSIIDGGAISVQATNSGDGGMITIDSRNSIVLDQGSITSEATQSNGGDITINSNNSIDLMSSRITSQATLDGGNISLTAPFMIQLQDSQVTAEAGGTGGNITIDPIHVILDNSQLIANAEIGNGGDIAITAEVFLVSPDSVIDASSQFGVSGNIDIFAPDVDIAGSLVTLSGSLLDAASQLQERCAVKLEEDVSSFVVVGRGGLPVEPIRFMPSFSAD